MIGFRYPYFSSPMASVQFPRSFLFRNYVFCNMVNILFHMFSVLFTEKRNSRSLEMGRLGGWTPKNDRRSLEKVNLKSQSCRKLRVPLLWKGAYLSLPPTLSSPVLTPPTASTPQTSAAFPPLDRDLARSRRGWSAAEGRRTCGACGSVPVPSEVV